MLVTEIDTSVLKKKRDKQPPNPDEFETNWLFVTGNTILSEFIEYTANMTLLDNDNIDTWDVYINNLFYGSDVESIQITTNDDLRIEVTKINPSLEGNLLFLNKLI
jgi:hypothetical protein